MRLERIVLEGFLSYRKKQEIDLTDITTCLVLGRINDDVDLSNGAGKSSLFESIPVNFFGKGSGRADLLDSYINDSMSKMYIEIIFKIDNQRFKTIRSKTRSTSALFEIFLDSTNKALKDATWKKTDKTIEDILGLSAKTYSSTIYLNERESLQVITGTSSERKEILRELLNIELYEKASKHCSRKFDEYDRKVQVNINMLLDKTKQLEQEEHFKEELKEIEIEIKDIKKTLKLKEKELKNCNEEKKKVEIRIETEKLIKEQLVQEQKIENEAMNATNEILGEIESLKQELEQQNAAYKRNKDSIEKSLKEKLIIKKTIEEQEETIKKLDVVDSEFKELIITLRSFHDKKNGIEASIAVAETELKPIKELLDKLDKFNVCPVTGAECPVIEGDYKKYLKTENEIDLSNCQEKIERLKEALQAIRETIKELTAKQIDLETKSKSRQRENEKLSKAKLNLQAISSQEAMFKEKEIEFKEYVKQTEEDKIKLADKLKKTKEKVEEQQKKIKEITVKIDSSLPQLLKEASVLVKKVEDEIKSIHIDYDEANQGVGEIKNKIDELGKIKVEIEHLTKMNEENAKQQKIYQTLSTIFGKDGIQKSVMKESIPLLEKYTTEFLKIFNEDSERIKVKFDLDPKRQDGEFKKGGGLDILVLEEGKDPKDLQMYSGGETVRIVFSVVLSLAKLLSLRAGKKHEALIIDEKIAKLDSRGISQFGEVISEISKIYKQVFVITHIENLKDLINGNEIIVNKTEEEGSLVTIS